MKEQLQDIQTRSSAKQAEALVSNGSDKDKTLILGVKPEHHTRVRQKQKMHRKFS